MGSLPDDNRPAASDAGEPARASGKAVASLVLGVMSIGLFCSFVTGLPAIVVGQLALMDIRRSRGKLSGRGAAIAGIATGGIGCMAVPLVAIFIVRAAQQDARRRESAGHMRWIALAVRGYHDTYKFFPAATMNDEAGNAQLSWRVAVFAHLRGHDRLFDEFNKQHPCNDPTTEAWKASEPNLYISPGVVDHPARGETNVLGIVDTDTVLTPGRGLNKREITDGTDRTIVAVELAGSGIVWSEPRDITIDDFIQAMRRSPSDVGLRPVYPGSVLCLFADGAVRWIPIGTPPETLRALCTRAGREQVAIPMVE